ncbi:MAG: tetratricopeptide repeat protein [Streptosporangiaceae bacterium]
MTQPRDFSMAGAIDLGARQAAAKRREQGPQPPGGAGSGYVFEATDATFNTEVVGRSQAAPVIVDLWAEWCEPCKQLGPVLEKLAAEAAGDWLLAKVDVDANPQLAAALQVQSIPMVVAVIGGQLVDGFLGALPEAQVRQWIAQILQVAEQLGMPTRVRGEAATTDAEAGPDQADARQAGPGQAESGQAGPAQAGPAQAGGQGPAGRPGPAGPGGFGAGPGGAGGPGGPGDVLADPRFESAQKAMDAGDLDAAAEALSGVLADSPDHPVARAWLAQVDLIRRVNSYDQASVGKAAQNAPDDVGAQLKAADLDLASGQIEASFDRLLGLFGRVSGDDRNQVRVHLLELFDVLPPRDPRVGKARSRLSSMLF